MFLVLCDLFVACLLFVCWVCAVPCLGFVGCCLFGDCSVLFVRCLLLVVIRYCLLLFIVCCMVSFVCGLRLVVVVVVFVVLVLIDEFGVFVFVPCFACFVCCVFVVCLLGVRWVLVDCRLLCGCCGVLFLVCRLVIDVVSCLFVVVFVR